MPGNPMNPQPPFAEPGKGLPEREIDSPGHSRAAAARSRRQPALSRTHRALRRPRPARGASFKFGQATLFRSSELACDLGKRVQDRSARRRGP
jgi:hypothetical protein